MDFAKIAPYLQDPLVLAGFALLLFFGTGNRLIKSGLIPQLSQRGGLRVLQRLLFYGFVLSIVIILLGFGLKYREMARREQIAAARLILNELKADRAVAGALAGNSAEILESSTIVALALRDKASPLLKTFFPWENLEPKDTTPSAKAMAEAAFQRAIDEGLPAQQIELNRMNAMARAIRGTLARTRGTLTSLGDQDHFRYRISRAAWSANLPVVRKISVIDLSGLERTYADLELSRSEYDVLVRYNRAYFDAVDQFLAFENNDANDDGLAKVLAAERQFFSVAATYGGAITRHIETSGTTIDALSNKVSELT
jgi:hypothetical protein